MKNIKENLKFSFGSTVGIFLILVSSPVWAQEGPSESLLVESERQEIADRARAETLAREEQKEQERLNNRRKELAQKIGEIRRRSADQQNLQQRYMMQIQGLENENNSLKARHDQLSREMEIIEGQARIQEATNLRVKTQLETTKYRLQEMNGNLDRRRDETKNKIEVNRQKIAEWASQITNVQNDIVKSDLMRIEYEKTLSRLEMQTADLERKLQESMSERNLMAQDVETAKIRHDKMVNKFTLLTEELKKIEAEKATILASQKKMDADFIAESKNLENRTKEIEIAKSDVQRERLRYIIDQRHSDELLRQIREKNEDIELAMSDEIAESSQAKLSYLKSREELTKQVANGSRLMLTDVKEVKFSGTQITVKSPRASTALPEKVVGGAPEPATFTKPVTESKPEANATKVPAEPVRNLAETNTNWKLSRLCNLYSAADTTSTKMKKLPGGTKVTAEENDARFMKVVDTSGKSGFVLKTCGSFY